VNEQLHECEEPESLINYNESEARARNGNIDALFVCNKANFALLVRAHGRKHNIVEFAALRAVYCEHLHNHLAALRSIVFNRNKEI
jgi:hypothetical protein